MLLQEFIALWQAQPFRAFRLHTGRGIFSVDYPQGVALSPHFMVAEDLKSGRLVRPFALAVRQPARWYLVCPSARLQDRAVQAFRAWLKDEIARDPIFLSAG